MDQPSPDRWRLVRRHLNAHRPELTRAAVELYPESPRVEGTTLLAPAVWLPPEPVEVADVSLAWSDAPGPAGVTGLEGESRVVRPAPFRSYSEAVAALDRPRLFENRPCFRMLDAGWPARLEFGLGQYFDVIDVCEAVAHELAGRALADGEPPDLVRLPFRTLLGDPLDLARRPVLPAICALTLRRDPAAGTAAFVLHWRDAGSVASGGGLYQVMPVGMFQPSGESAEDVANDFDLWRGLARELSEEFLDVPEHRSRPGEPIDYEAWPFFRALEAGRERGAVRAWCLGHGVDPLTLAADILIAVVIDADVYDPLLGPSGGANDEGRIVRSLAGAGGGPAGIDFSAENVEAITGSYPMQPAGAAVLRRAWRQRARLLDP